MKKLIYKKIFIFETFKYFIKTNFFSIFNIIFIKLQEIILQ